MSPRRLVALLHDIIAAGIAWAFAFWLRFNLDLPADAVQLMLKTLPWVVVIHGAVFLSLGLYRGLWRYASLPDLQRIVLAVGLAALAVPTVFTLARTAQAVPRTVYLLTPILLVLAIGGSRLAYRAWREGRLMPVVSKPQATPILVLGAGNFSSSLLKELAASAQWRVVGLLDDDPGKQGAAVQGVKVLGPIDRVEEIAAKYRVSQMVIAMPGATHTARKRALDLCTHAGLSVMTVPALADIVSGRVSVSIVAVVCH